MFRRPISRMWLVPACVLTLGLLGSLSAGAATFSNVVIVSIQLRNNGMVYVEANQQSTGVSAGCSGTPIYATLDSTTAEGKSMLTVVQAAYATGKRVDMVGTGTCLASYEQLGKLEFRL